MGQDLTLRFTPLVDFRFVNDAATPLLIETEVDAEEARCDLSSTGRAMVERSNRSDQSGGILSRQGRRCSNMMLRWRPGRWNCWNAPTRGLQRHWRCGYRCTREVLHRDRLSAISCRGQHDTVTGRGLSPRPVRSLQAKSKNAMLFR
jgi:hypothetical protein